MGVYIKGMEMPVRCVDCPCRYKDRGDNDGFFSMRDGCGALKIIFNEHVYYGRNIHDPYTKVYEDCPLIEVKEPHGRLIDADELVNRIVFHTNLPTEIKEAVEDAIEDAPTVIEAEEG